MRKNYWRRGNPALLAGLTWGVITWLLPGSLTAAPLTGTLHTWGALMTRQPGTVITNIAAGGDTSLGIQSDGTVIQWGYRYYDVLTNGITMFSGMPTRLSGVRAVSASKSTPGFAMALTDRGTVAVWGQNGLTAVAASLQDVAAVSSGNRHCVALRSNGQFTVWSGTLNSTLCPFTNLVAVAAGGPVYWSACLALDAGGHAGWWAPEAPGSSSAFPTEYSNVAAIATGYDHHLLLHTDGTVSTVGSISGETLVSGLSNVIAIAAGGGTPCCSAASTGHSLALKRDGTVAAWGNNDRGQTNVPFGLNRVVAIAAGGGHSLALQPDGTLVSWGDNTYGQRLTPPIVQDPVAVSVGTYHGLVVRGDHTVTAWGDNEGGQCTVPAGLSDVVGVAAGTWHSLALLENGRVAAWGDSFFGATAVPPDLREVIQVAAGEWQSTALKRDGTVVVWGTSTTDMADVPTDLTNAISVSACALSSLALTREGKVVAWGSTNEDFVSAAAGLSNVVAVSAGRFYGLALLQDGTVRAWGWGGTGQTNVPPGLSNVVAIAAGHYHCLALKADGTVAAWGLDGGGAVTGVAGYSNVVAIVAGDSCSGVVVADRPTISLEINGSVQSLRFHTFMGRHYLIEYTSDLHSASWLPTPGGTVAGTGRELVVTVANGLPETPARFYRVRASAP